jgi:basic membrane protein A and related proteins
MNPTAKVADQFPDIKFEHATGYKRDDNLATYSARFYEGRAVIGTIAGHMTKAGSSATSAPSRFPKWYAASTPSPSPCARSIPKPKSRWCG